MRLHVDPELRTLSYKPAAKVIRDALRTLAEGDMLADAEEVGNRSGRYQLKLLGRTVQYQIDDTTEMERVIKIFLVD